MQLNPRQSHRQGKPPRAGAAGVEEEDAVFVFQVGTVGVAEDDRGRCRRRRGPGPGRRVRGGRRMRLPPTSTTRVWGRSAAQSPRSVLPRTACTGAIRSRAGRIFGSPMSPAWMMSSTPSRAWTAWGRSKPWVSEMTPIRCSVIKIGQGRGGPRVAPRPGEKRPHPSGAARIAAG